MEIYEIIGEFFKSFLTDDSEPFLSARSNENSITALSKMSVYLIQISDIFNEIVNPSINICYDGTIDVSFTKYASGHTIDIMCVKRLLLNFNIEGYTYFGGIWETNVFSASKSGCQIFSTKRIDHINQELIDWMKKNLSNE